MRMCCRWELPHGSGTLCSLYGSIGALRKRVGRGALLCPQGSATSSGAAWWAALNMQQRLDRDVRSELGVRGVLFIN